MPASPSRVDARAFFPNDHDRPLVRHRRLPLTRKGSPTVMSSQKRQMTKSIRAGLNVRSSPSSCAPSSTYWRCARSPRPPKMDPARAEHALRSARCCSATRHLARWQVRRAGVLSRMAAESTAGGGRDRRSSTGRRGRQTRSALRLPPPAISWARRGRSCSDKSSYMGLTRRSPCLGCLQLPVGRPSRRAILLRLPNQLLTPNRSLPAAAFLASSS